MNKRDPLHEKVLETCRRYELFDGAHSVLVGVSGGQDSVALLHALVTIRELDLRVGVAHLHHGMRGAHADEDEEYVEDLAERLGASFYAERRDVLAEGVRDGLNAEQSGRRARYSLFARVMAEANFDRIATGHTGTDRAETLLLNLFRGAGLDGMSSIPPKRGKIVRPLIGVTREDTEDYCKRHALPYRTDLTNLDPEHARRNAVRLEIMPRIKELVPEADGALVRACEAVEEELEWTDPMLAEWVADATISHDLDRSVLSLTALARMPSGALQRALRMAVEATRGDLLAVSREQIERLAALVRGAEVSTEVELPGGWVVRRGYKELTLERAQASVLPGEEAQPLPVPGSAYLSQRRIEVTAELVTAPERLDESAPETAYISPGAAGAGLVLRSWQEGERFQPLGMEGTKKLSDLFTDLKIERDWRHFVPVVARPSGEIVWVVGVRVSEVARATAGAPAVMLSAHPDEER